MSYLYSVDTKILKPHTKNFKVPLFVFSWY